jgi:hypothetical protein
MMRFKFRSVVADGGHVLVHVTTFLPLGMTKEIHVRLTPDDARRLITHAEIALTEIARTLRLTT